jgi:hypothetical protein
MPVRGIFKAAAWASQKHNVLGRLRRRNAGDMQQAKFRIVGRSDFFLPAHRRDHREIHVRLPGAKPHLADEEVVQLDPVLAANGHKMDLAVGGHGRQDNLPVALGIGRGGRRCLVERHGDLFAGVGPAPDRQRPIALQDHMAAEDLGQGNLCLGLAPAGPDEKRQGKNNAT